MKKRKIKKIYSELKKAKQAKTKEKILKHLQNAKRKIKNIKDIFLKQLLIEKYMSYTMNLALFLK